MPEERSEADVGLGRHADIVGERKALVDFTDKTRVATPVAVASRERERLRRRRARIP